MLVLKFLRKYTHIHKDFDNKCVVNQKTVFYLYTIFNVTLIVHNDCYVEARYHDTNRKIKPDLAIVFPSGTLISIPYDNNNNAYNEYKIEHIQNHTLLKALFRC